MPLSRLSPRSSGKSVAPQRSKNRAQADVQKHLSLWAAIRQTRHDLDQWNQQTLLVDTLFREFIAPREYVLTNTVCDVTQQLIKHFSNRDLDMPNQSLLGLWITDNLHSLQEHPFSDASKTGLLSASWLEQLNQEGLVENQLARLARQHNFEANVLQAEKESAAVQNAPQCDTSQMPDDEAPQSSQETIEPEQSRDKLNSDSEKPSQDSNKSDTNHNKTSINETINTLESKLSVERLFRQLAKVLHPDREQDEQVKAAKHVLMSECLKARKQKDINALLTLYCEHVGELPDDLNNNSHHELINALETQLKQLQRELREKRFGDPLHTMIVERYWSANEAECKQRIVNHARSLDEEIENSQDLFEKLGSDNGLLDALYERRALEQDRMAINELTGL